MPEQMHMSEGVTVNDLNVGEISWRTVPGQEFAPKSDFLSGIEILMATFARKNTCKMVLRVVRLSEGMKEEIRTVEEPASAFHDNNWHSFNFKPIPDSAGTTIYFYLESPDATEGDALTAWASSSAAPAECRMYLNHMPVPGSLCFRPLYSPLVDPALKEEWDSWSRNVETACSMMDGSRTEDDLRIRGGIVASVLRDLLSLQPTDRVLEIGCGVGRVSRELAPHAGKYACVDISQGLLKLARRRMEHLGNVSFFAIGDKPLDDFEIGCFDKILSHLVFFHLPRELIFEYLRQCARLLSPGGLAYFDTWNLSNPAAFDRWLAEVQMYRGKEKPRSYNRFHTRQEIDVLVKAAGLRTVGVSESTMLQYLVERDGGKGQPRAASPGRETWARLEDIAVNYLEGARSRKA